MKALFKLLLRIIAVIIGVAVVASLVIWGVRSYNVSHYRIPGTDPQDRSALLAESDLLPVDGEYLRGFHLEPATTTVRPGTVVVFGGSEGGANLDLAREIRDRGFHVLALYYFGQEGQPEELVEVPLDFFDEALTWISAQRREPGPLTVIGGSKGAELTANLAVRYPEIDHIVLYSPGEYTYAGLSFGGEQRSSFTWRGEPVPFAAFSSSPSIWFPLVWRSTLALPVSYRASYEAAATEAPADARIDVSSFSGSGVLFAGTADPMWQSEIAARALAADNPRLEAVLLDDAGHLFAEDITAFGPVWETMLGGTVEGNRLAKETSDRILYERLDAWHAPDAPAP